jgi:inosose dehydratase
MSIQISSAPCCWGVDDPKNPYLPPWERVLDEAQQAGYKGIELGPYGYLPLDLTVIGDALKQRELSIVAGTIFDDLVHPDNLPNLVQQTHDICDLIRQLPSLPTYPGKSFNGPYLVIIDWGHPERDKAAGRPDEAARLSDSDWHRMMDHIKTISEIAWEEYGVRPVIHPHAGGHIEFEDELAKLSTCIPYETAGLCLDTGHLYYSKMDPVQALIDYQDSIDYVHFKDINLEQYEHAMDSKLPFFEACAEGVMCRIGEGVLNYPKIKSTLEKIDYQGFITVEQERDPRDNGSSLADVKASRDYLFSIGF